MASSDRVEMLNFLDVYGKQFLNLFEPSTVTGKRTSPEPQIAGKRKKRRVEKPAAVADEEEEWTGFSETESELDIDEDIHDEDVKDAAESSSTDVLQPNVVVFTEHISKAQLSTQATTKAQQKAFMSSRVNKVTMQIPDSETRKDRHEEEDDDDLNNAQNDALLHRLVHTQILSGSLNSELDMTPAQRQKALAGRVMEIAGHAKLGKGESAVRNKERNKNAKRIRDGLLSKQKARNQKELEEAKNMGNYHPALKQLFNNDSAPSMKRKRERGLKMGVGSFSGGVLHLNRDDIASVSGFNKPQTRKGSRRK